jgi:Xaa-Pro aminopeptidase
MGRYLVFVALIVGSPVSLAATSSDYIARRARLAEAIGPSSIFIALSAPVAQRNGDVTWPYRQDDNLLYLTGVSAPDTSLVIIPAESEYAENLFTPEAQTSAPALRQNTGIEQIEPAWRFRWFLEAALTGGPWGPSDTNSVYRPSTMPKTLDAVRSGRVEIWLLLGQRAVNEQSASAAERLAAELRRRFPEVAIRDAWPLLVQMREVKSRSEIETIQRAVDITVAAQRAAMRRVLTASHEYQIQATVEHVFRDSGACCWAFPSIIASGRNALVYHYTRNSDAIARDALILVDIGAEVDGYAADVARTFPAGGSFSTEQKTIYNTVLAAHEESSQTLRPGRTLLDVYDTLLDALAPGLLELGLIAKPEPEQIKMYLHSTAGHHVGLQVHDVFTRGRGLEPGMVVVNEPFLRVNEAHVRATSTFQNLSTADQERIEAALERYGGITVQIEDVFVITEAVPRNLSAAAPRTVAEIEAWMSQR